MKCRYNDCKHGGSVAKEEAIKDGNAYYHKECFKEKKTKTEIENYYTQNMPQTTLMLLRKAIKQLLTEKGFEAEYVLYVCKWIVSNKKPIRVPFGLVNYCSNGYLLDEWNKKKVNIEYNKMRSETCEIEIEGLGKPSFTYKPTKKRITDII